MPGQLAFPFGVEQALRRESFILAPCNEDAFHFIERWPDWPARAAALYGPPGCGKSHLAAVWQKIARAHAIAAHVLNLDLIALFEGDVAFLIEDLDLNEPKTARDQALLALFERPKATLLFTGRAAPSEWQVTIPDLRSRFLSLLAFPLWAPDDTLLSALIVKHFADRQLQVPESAVKRILSSVERTPDAIARFVALADEKALAEKRSISERLVLELIEAGPPR